MGYEVSILLNYFLIFIENIAYMTFSSSFFQQKISGYKYIISLTGLTVLSIFCLTISESNVVFKLILLICIDSLWVVIMYHTFTIKCIGISVLFVSFVNVIDNSFFIGSTMLSNINMQELYQDPYGYYLICYIAKICEVLIFAAVGLFVKQKFYFNHVTWKHWLEIFILPATSLFVAVFLWSLYWIVPSAADTILLCTIALFVINLFSIAVLNYLDQQQQLYQDNLVLQKSIQYQNEAVGAWADAYKNQRKMTHDFQNQLSVIYGLAECEAPNGELLSYIQTILKNSMTNSLIVKTGRLVADVLLSQKYDVAQAKDIQFVLQLDDLTHFGLEDEHLVVVLSNLIDNAIEACEKIDNGKSKKITLVMKVEEESSFLYIENTTAFPVKILDNQSVIPMKPSTEHGYGLKNVVNILNQYHTVFAITYKEDSGLFCFSTQIPSTL